MKTFPCLLLLPLLYSCASQPYFKSPNDVIKQKVVLYVRDQPEQTGLLTILFEHDFNRPVVPVNTLTFIPDGKTGVENINLNEVIGYSFNNNYYALKDLFLPTDNRYHLLFTRRLTSADSRIQLYELYESGNGNATGESHYSYFISLPAFAPYQTLSTDNHDLVPDFDQKMSALVSDCPALAEKIANREDGYFIPAISFNTFKHKTVMTKIINEYNSCPSGN